MEYRDFNHEQTNLHGDCYPRCRYKQTTKRGKQVKVKVNVWAGRCVNEMQLAPNLFANVNFNNISDVSNIMNLLKQYKFYLKDKTGVNKIVYNYLFIFVLI